MRIPFKWDIQIFIGWIGHNSHTEERNNVVSNPNVLEIISYKTIIPNSHFCDSSINLSMPDRQIPPAHIISSAERSSKTSPPKTSVISFLGQAIYEQFVDVDLEGLRSCWPTTQQPRPFPLFNSIKGQALVDRAPPAASCSPA